MLRQRVEIGRRQQAELAELPRKFWGATVALRAGVRVCGCARVRWIGAVDRWIGAVDRWIGGSNYISFANRSLARLELMI